MAEEIVLDGESLTPETLFKLSQGKCKLSITEQAQLRVNKSREVVDRIVESGKVVYGINTGFGYFANVRIPPGDLSKLQANLIRSHCVGVGTPLSPERTRMLLALRINVLSKGFSGIGPELLNKMLEAYNKDCLPFIPEQGTVGASGDLAPLAHLSLGLMGEGLMWDQESSSYLASNEVAAKKGFQYVSELKPKEGLAMINGTQMICALLTEAYVRCFRLALTADVLAALSSEVLRGTARAYMSSAHEARPHPGQITVAKRLRQLISTENISSQISDSHKDCGKVQDAYSLRCVPQVHGAVWDAIEYVRKGLTIELNSATDNPMIFPDNPPEDQVVSAGNFHGEYPAKLCDTLAIYVHELSSISETRIQRLMDSNKSELPHFLTEEPGLNSGLMMAHCTAAALVSENKSLVHPASTDTITTSAGQEDHVSMGGWAARKLLKVVENVENVLAIELLSLNQGIEFLRPLRTSEPLERVIQVVRQKVPYMPQDSVLYDKISKLREMIVNEEIISEVKDYLN